MPPGWKTVSPRFILPAATREADGDKQSVSYVSCTSPSTENLLIAYDATDLKEDGAGTFALFPEATDKRRKWREAMYVHFNQTSTNGSIYVVNLHLIDGSHKSENEDHAPTSECNTPSKRVRDEHQATLRSAITSAVKAVQEEMAAVSAKRIREDPEAAVATARSVNAKMRAL